MRKRMTPIGWLIQSFAHKSIFLRSPAFRWIVAITIACRTYYCLRLARIRTALISFRAGHFQSSRGNSFRWAHISGGVRQSIRLACNNKITFASSKIEMSACRQINYWNETESRWFFVDSILCATTDLREPVECRGKNREFFFVAQIVRFLLLLLKRTLLLIWNRKVNFLENMQAAQRHKTS